MVYLRGGTVMQEPTYVDRVLSFPYKIYEFILFFIMTLIDVRTALRPLLPPHAPTLQSTHCRTAVRQARSHCMPSTPLPFRICTVAAKGGQKGRRDHAELCCAEWRRQGRWQWAPRPGTSTPTRLAQGQGQGQA